MTMKRILRALALVTVGVVAAIQGCGSNESKGGGGDDDGNEVTDPAEAFTLALDFGGQASPTVGPLPDGNTTGPTVTPLPGTEPNQAAPGAGITFQIPWQGGNIVGINIGFGGSKYFTIPVPDAMGQTEGVVNVGAQVSADVCSNLGDICHQIQCYEQVQLPDGTVSKAAAMQIVLNCTGGQDCNGNTGGAGVGGGGSGGSGSGGAPPTGTCGDPNFPIDCGTFCCTSAGPVCGNGVCCKADEAPCAEGCCPSGGTCPPSIPEDCATCCPGDTCCPNDLYCCGDCDTGC